MVWKPQMNCREKLLHSKPQNPILRNPNRLVTTEKNQATREIDSVNSNEKNAGTKTLQIVLVTTITTTEVKQTLTPKTRIPAKPTPTRQTAGKTKNQVCLPTL